MIGFVKGIFHQPLFICFLSIIVCAFFYYLKSEKKAYKRIIWISYSLVFAFALLIFIGNAIYRIYHPEVWDFACAYLYGKTAVAGYNFYLPENFQLVFNSLNLPFSDYQGMVEAVVNTGFHFPPPTILLFFPLGFFSFKTALIVWTIFNMIFVYGCIYLIYKMFFKENKLNGFLLGSILLFILRPSISTITFSQTNFILLFLLLLTKKYQDKKISGLFLVLAVFVKPYAIIFALFFMLRMKWKTIVYSIISAFIIVGVTFILIGREPFISYIFNNPIHRFSASTFSDPINQSLHAVLLRNNLITLNQPMTYVYIISGILLLAAFYLFYLLKRRLYDYILPVLLLVALLIYPGTLSYYGVLLLFIIFQFFNEKKQLGFHQNLNIPIIGIFYFLSTFSLFATVCFLLLVIISKSLSIFQQNKFIASLV